MLHVYHMHAHMHTHDKAPTEKKKKNSWVSTWLSCTERDSNYFQIPSSYKQPRGTLKVNQSPGTFTFLSWSCENSPSSSFLFNFGSTVAEWIFWFNNACSAVPFIGGLQVFPQRWQHATPFTTTNLFRRRSLPRRNWPTSYNQCTLLLLSTVLAEAERQVPQPVRSVLKLTHRKNNNIQPAHSRWCTISLYKRTLQIHQTKLPAV